MPPPVPKSDPKQQGSEPTQKQKLPQTQTPEQPPIEKPQKEKPKVKQSKDESLKYTMTYANGGFNNGVELKPGRNGKIELSITIYGGGEKKSLGISNINPEVQKLIKAYEVGAESDQDTEQITSGLKDYFNKVNQVLSLKIINILQDTDSKIKEAIKQTFKEVK